ncbi:MAG: polyhydroxyalkanoate synthesis regulator DNA-binding domain-containing protein [Candidatus Binatia bacterium]
MSRVVKRYGNRKLYDTQESRYVTLEDIAGFVKAGEELRVVDNDSGEDLTAVTFAQIILEEERKKNGFLPLPILRKIIQHGEETIQDLASRVDKGMEAIGSAGKRVQELVGRSAAPGKGLLDELVSSSQKRLELLQKEIDDRVKSSVDRLTSLPAVKAVQKEITRIEKSIERLEQKLSRLRTRPGGERGSDRTPPE